MNKRIKLTMPKGVTMSGIDLKMFKTNPVILMNHDHNSLPIGVAENIKTYSRGITFDGAFNSLTNNATAVKFLQKEGLIKQGYPGGVIDGDKFIIHEISICP